MELWKVDLLEEAMEKLVSHAGRKEKGIIPDKREISVCESYGCILAEDVICRENIPHFRRSTVDGYAVHAQDTGGASEGLPVFLVMVGEVLMGEEVLFRLEPGECAYVPTGGMIPDGADAMVMTEYCEHCDGKQIAVYDSVSYGKNIVFPGDDIQKGQRVLKKGRRIRPADMGVLASIGKSTVTVYRPWRIAVLSTGDEIVEPNVELRKGRIRDVNSYGIVGQIQKFGLELAGYEVICDKKEILKDKIVEAMGNSDVVVVSGGSSQGRKDATMEIIDGLSSGGAFTHGVAVKPGKPTILGYHEDSRTVLVGLPGHPVAALLLFELIIGGLWRKLTGMKETEKVLPIQGKLMCNIAAAPGRKTYQLVRVQKEENGFLVIPVLGESGLIRTMSEADGVMVIGVNDEGANRGDIVPVYLLDGVIEE